MEFVQSDAPTIKIIGDFESTSKRLSRSDQLALDAAKAKRERKNARRARIVSEFTNN